MILPIVRSKSEPRIASGGRRDTVIMTEVIARVHSVHLVNVEQRQAAVDPQTKPHDLGCESTCRLLSSTTTIAILYYYSARKADTHLPSHGG